MCGKLATRTFFASSTRALGQHVLVCNYDCLAFQALKECDFTNKDFSVYVVLFDEILKCAH